MKSLFLVAAFLFGALVSVSEASAQTLHAIIFADQSPSAGWGKNAPNITFDVLKMFAAMNNHVPESQLNYQSATIDEDQYSSPQFVREVLSEVSPQPGDTLLVYYSGHGGSDDRGHFLQLAKGKLYRDELRKLMEQKGARLNVLITDCCNVRSDGKRMMAPAPWLEPPRALSPLFRSLFFTSNGWVDLNGSSPGEGAFFPANIDGGDSPPGSIFTTQLADFFDRYESQATTWEHLVREVGLGVSATFKDEYPKGASVGKGAPIQSEQNVYAIEYPGMPQRSGPRSGVTVRDHDGRGAFITVVRPGFPAERVYHLRSKQYVSLKPKQVIVAVNGKPVTGAMSFSDAVKESPQMMRLKIREGNRTDEYLMRLRY